MENHSRPGSMVPRSEAREVTMGRETQERGKRREKAFMKREGEKRKEERETKMSRLYRKKPLGRGSPSPSLESSG